MLPSTFSWLAIHILVGFPAGLFLANGAEWVIHKRVLHGWGKRKGNFWNFHWYEHHNVSRRHAMLDDAYAAGWIGGGWNGRTKEAVALTAGVLVWVPLLPIAPGLAAAFVYATGNYYWKHKKAHLDPDWARRHLPWHVDHHLGPNQDANWCVTRPWFDLIMGTREPWVGTPQETARRARATAQPAGITMPDARKARSTRSQTSLEKAVSWRAS